jgi:hypothetical protein
MPRNRSVADSRRIDRHAAASLMLWFLEYDVLLVQAVGFLSMKDLAYLSSDLVVCRKVINPSPRIEGSATVGKAVCKLQCCVTSIAVCLMSGVGLCVGGDAVLSISSSMRETRKRC